MRRWVLMVCAAGVFASSLQAATYQSGSIDVAIPDGNPAGWSTAVPVSGQLPVITDVSVTLQISGGYNGDLYAYLSHGDGVRSVLLPLLNRVGVTAGNAFGYSAPDMNVTLADGYADIHGVQSPGSGPYAADGRQISPLAAASDIENATRIGFSAFDGMSPNGTWTLFFADLSAGAQSQLNSWSLTILADVPEPVNVALGIFGGVVLVVALARTRWLRDRLNQWRVAIVQWIDAV